ncbi:MAG: nucleotidyltransferase domain-containing protein [Clostridia bacterium]|nr:nucleotidyltransferase domain-containing protein [Clostridia bacterium]
MKELPNKVNGIIETFITKVNELLGERVKKIILYGSYARGDFRTNSDIDIMILTDLTDNEIIEYRDKVSDIAFDIEFDNEFDIMLSPLVKNIDKFNYWLEALPFYINIQKEGVVLSESKNI